MPNYGFVPASDARNKKLGHMAYISAPSENCDDNCPFRGDGCYAENPPFSWVWDKHQSGVSRHSVNYAQMLNNVRRMPRGDKLRWFVGGDFPKNGTGGVDCIKATQIAKASIGKKTIVFTHHQPWSGNGAWGATIRDLKLVNGFQVNVSCESERQVDAYIADDIDCVLTVPSTETRKQWRTAGGNRVRVCPQQLHEGVTCEQCMLCSSRPDDMVIAFKGHGTRVKKFNQVLTSANQ